MTNAPSVLVTGGAGYVGAHCAKALAQAGFEPVVFDDLATGHRAFARFGPLIEGDVRDRSAFDTAFVEHRPVAVIHLAALSVVAQSVAEPERYRAVNVEGTACLLAAMADHGVAPLVFSSTASVYGEPAITPIPEDAPLNPTNPYGATKAEAERLIAAAPGVRAARLRYFNAAGADPGGEIGEAHDPETHLVPTVLDVALGRRPALEVFGDDFPTADGTAVRDYVHVVDLAAAHVAALEALLAGREVGALNLGTGRGASVREVVETARAVTGRDIPVQIAARRPGDVAALVAKADRAHAVLGWAPKRSDIETIVADAWAWHVRRFA